MRASVVQAAAVHGESGIDGTNLLPIPTVQPKPGSAILGMREAIMNTPPQSHAVVCTVALVDISPLIPPSVSMGGQGMRVIIYD